MFDKVGRDVWRLRRDVLRHPVHSWAAGSVERTALLVHKGFCQWGSAALAASVAMAGPGRHLQLTVATLRREGVGRCLESFFDEVATGANPLRALATAGDPAAVAPLVKVVGQLLAGGSEDARLGAFTLGVPCCTAHTGPALDRLGPPGREAAEAARALLIAQIALYDGAFQAMRRRQMTLHPSAWRPGRPVIAGAVTT